MNSEAFKVIAEFVDKASPGLVSLMGLVNEFAKGVLEGAAAELKLAEANVQLADKTKKATSPMQELEGSLKKLAVQFIAVTTVANAFLDVIKEADKLDDLSEKTGISAGNLRELSYAAKIGGTSLDALVGAMDKLGKSADKSEDEMSKQAKTFKQLGVETENLDGSLKSSEQLMMDLADAFQGIEDGPEKSAAAFRLFGSEAKNLLPLLSKGSEEFKRLREESAQLSGISSGVYTEFAKATGDMFDNFDKLGQVVNGLFTSIGSELVPVFNVLLTELIESSKEGGLLREVLDGIGVVMTNVVVPGIKLAAIALNGFFATLKIVGSGIGAVAAALVAVFQGDFKRASSIMSDFSDEAAKTAQGVVDFQAKIALAGREAVKLADNVDKPTRKLSALGGKAKEVKSELAEMVTQLRIANQSFGLDDATKQMLEAQAKYVKDIKAGINPDRANALLKEANALLEMNRALKEATAGQEAYDAAQTDIQTMNDQAELYRYEATLVGKSADERERLIEKFKEEIELRKIVAGLSETDAAKVAEQYRTAQQARADAKAAADDAKTMNDLYSQSSAAATEDFSKRIQLLAQLYEAGKISLEDFTKIQQSEFDKLLEKNKKTADEATVFWQEAAKGIQGALQEFLFDFMQGNLTNLGDSFKKVIDQMVANALAAKLGQALFGGSFEKNGSVGGLVGSGLSALSELFGGFRANGGDVQAGKAYVVGERQAELFVPKTSGTVYPSTEGLGGGSTNLNFNIQTYDSKDMVNNLGKVARPLVKVLGSARGRYNLGGY